MEAWKKCSVCKKEIPLRTPYYVCSVSGCKSKRKGYVFCRIQCWDEHKAVLNHRNAWAEELMSPSSATPLEGAEREKKRIIIDSPSPAGASFSASPLKPIQTETLVVVSKVKKLVKDLSDMNTSQCAVDALTEIVVRECRKGIEGARNAGRKTVMGRDFEAD